MKPNLFRSISNALAETFPLLPRIRRSFWGLLLFCALLMLLDLSSETGVSVVVKPITDSVTVVRPVVTYPSGNIQSQGLLTLDHPTLIQRLMFPGPFTDIDCVTLLCMGLASIIIILIVPKLQQHTVFRKDITMYIRMLGWLLIVHGIFSWYRIAIFLPTEIEKLTAEKYTAITHFPIIVAAELYVAMIVLALAGLYKKGIQLQEEQDLTV
jgi:hypothetical protein